MSEPTGDHYKDHMIIRKQNAEIARLRDIISPGNAAAYEEGMAALEAKLAEAQEAGEKWRQSMYALESRVLGLKAQVEQLREALAEIVVLEGAPASEVLRIAREALRGGGE